MRVSPVKKPIADDVSVLANTRLQSRTQTTLKLANAGVLAATVFTEASTETHTWASDRTGLSGSDCMSPTLALASCSFSDWYIMALTSTGLNTKKEQRHRQQPPESKDRLRNEKEREEENQEKPET
jgi:hypothetical protein